MPANHQHKISMCWDPRVQAMFKVGCCCSCYMCGNPRRYWKRERLTIQEKREVGRDRRVKRSGGRIQ